MCHVINDPWPTWSTSTVLVEIRGVFLRVCVFNPKVDKVANFVQGFVEPLKLCRCWSQTHLSRSRRVSSRI